MIYLALKKIIKLSMRAAFGFAAAVRLFFSDKSSQISGEEAFKKLCEVYPFKEVSVVGESFVSPEYDLQIIVPAYNAEKYIEKCVLGIAEQETGFSLRLVVIDDGSVDKTGEIADRLLKEFNKGRLKNDGGLKSFEVIHSENGGAAAARNKGLEKILGRYVMFCDADDVLAEGAVEKLMKAAISSGADIAEGSISAVDEKGRVCDRFMHKSGELSPMELFGYPFGKVFKAELLKNIRFPEGYWFEDSVFKYCVYPFAKKCIGLDEIVYSYLRNYGGVSKQSLKSPRAVTTFYLTAALWQYMAERTGSFSMEIRKQLLHQLAVNYRRTYLLGDEINKYGFFYVRESYLNLSGRGDFKGLPVLYRLLDRAAVKGDFKSYKLLCRKELYL